MRDLLATGSRGEVGEAAAVARICLDDPPSTRVLVAFLEDDDPAVVAHAAHALMQVARDSPGSLQTALPQLLIHLEKNRQWEIAEQLPKVLVRLKLDDTEVSRLFGLLEDLLDASSAIGAASALTAIVDLARQGRVDRALAEQAIRRALASPRKAVAARARRLEQELSEAKR
ncbi:MAG: hypothetical protein M9905_03995 [Rhizobiaceae bacterium]|nr:hypothetical protein [Rhizobiaceae bacterium]